MRLKDCEGWVSKWQVIESFSGAPGLSAEDAAYSTAVLQEYLEVTEQEYCGGIADILKCFDQIQRPLLEVLLRLAGLPEKLVKPYIDCFNKLTVYNTFAGHIG